MSTFTQNEIRFGRNRNTKFTNETAGVVDTYVDVDGVPTRVASTNQITVGTDAAVTLTSAAFGTVVTLPQLASADRTYTLPTQLLGARIDFVYTGAAVCAYDYRISCGNSDFFIGGVVFHDLDGNTSAAVIADGSADDHFDIVVPEAGTNFFVISDGTTWHIGGTVSGDTTPAFATS